MDRLSDLPSCIIEMILCLIPIQEAGRTSILSREWRYRWTKIPKLVFEKNTFQVSTVDGAEQKYLEPHERQKMERSKLIYAVGQVLLMHDGPVDEFSLSLVNFDQRAKIDTIFTLLSTKTSIKKLQLDFNYVVYRLPSSILSFHQLTDLSLIHCYFDNQPTFSRFNSLTNLHLEGVFTSTRAVQHLLSGCPLLKTVILHIISKYRITRSNDGPTFTELLECLPLIETLSLWFEIFEFCGKGVDDGVPRELPTPLFHLKYLHMYHLSFSRKQELIIAFLIKSSPNLEKLKIFDNSLSLGYPKSSSITKCYPRIMLEHLNELEIRNFINHKTRLDFVKLILTRSPVLKKVRIFTQCKYHHERLQILEILLGSSCASPEVQIIVEDSCEYCSFGSTQRKKPM